MQIKPVSPVHALARMLGVERRRNVRQRYPLQTTCGLPVISFKGNSLRAMNISVGGCSLLDPRELLGPQIGNEIALQLTWSDQYSHVINSRVVSRVDHRRHIQFLDLPESSAMRLADRISFSVRGIRMVLGPSAEIHGPTLMAKELWTSIDGDTLTIEDGLHRAAVAVIGDQEYSFFKDTLPIGPGNDHVSPYELEKLILFLANFEGKSRSISSLQANLEALYMRGGTA